METKDAGTGSKLFQVLIYKKSCKILHFHGRAYNFSKLNYIYFKAESLFCR